jgi:3-isopropylmalate dehydrogenase
MIEQAIANVLAKGMRTADIGSGSKTVGTEEMGEAIVSELDALKA